ncbi:MAG TPA: hypothetical protein VIV58_28890, partial [Kofleriaceae bacterium]
MGEERAKAKAVKPVDKKPPLAPVAPPLFAPFVAGSPPGGNALAALMGVPIGNVPYYAEHDPITEDNALAAALARDDRATALAILERNKTPHDIYGLIRNWEHGSLIDALWHVRWSDSQWGQILAYLGDQLPLDLQIRKHEGDRDAVFRDLQRIPDGQALGFFIDAAALIHVTTTPADDGSIPPAFTTRDAVADALRAALSADDYFLAMRQLLQKASRAQHLARPQPVAGSLDLGLPGTGPFALLSLPSPDDPTGIDLVAFDVVKQAHVELVLGIVREADTKDWDKDQKARSRAYLALADLDGLERRLASRDLDKAITNNLLSIGGLQDILAKDDVTAVRTLITDASYSAGMLHQSVDPTMLDVAIDRAGQLVREARSKADATPPDSEQRTQAQAEADRVTGSLLDWDMMAAVRRDPSALEARLKALGAPPLQIGVELLRQVASDDFDAIIAALRRIDPAVRIDAMQDAGLLDRIPDFQPEQRELLAAYLTVGREPAVHPTKTTLDDMSQTERLLYWNQSPPTELPRVQRDDGPIVFGVDTPADLRLMTRNLYAARPRTTIAIDDILRDIASGHGAAALGRIRQLEPNDRIEVYADDRVRKAIEGIDDNEVKDALREAWWDAGGEAFVLAVRSKDTQAIFEATAARGDMADMRRGFVLAHRKAANPSLELTDEEDNLLQAYDIALAKAAPLSGWQDKETFKHILLGQPGLGLGGGGPDPTMEAEFMAFRIDERAGARDPSSAGQQLEDAVEHSGPRADEAVARFRTLYATVREGGVTPGELAQLAERYHEAMRALDKFQEDNVAFAHKVARIVGGVVATVIVIACTAGAATPFVTAALAGLGAGAAEAATGAAIRTESSLGQVATDFASGTVDGIAMAVGNQLGSAAVEALWAGEAAGAGAGVLAARAGATAMTKVSKGFFAAIVENSIAGAVGGAASEIFETATDRVTWDRGIAEAFAKIMAAAARGAAMGAVTAGVITAGLHGLGALASVIAKLERNNSPAVARGVARLLEASGAEANLIEALADRAESQLVKAYELIEAGRLNEAEELIERLALPAEAAGRMIEFARARVALRAVRELGGLPEGAHITPEVLDAKQYEALVGKQRGDAATIITDGKPRVIVKAGASPTVIREEIVHVVQFYTDPVMKARMLMLTPENLAGWATKTAEQKAELFAAKLELEADAQRRILGMLEEDLSSGESEAGLRALDAQETLNKLDERLAALRAARAAGTLEEVVPKDAPFLFAKGAQTRISKRAAAEVKRLVKSRRGLNVNKPKDLETLERFGYVPGKSNKKIFRLSRTTEATDVMPHLQVESDGSVVIGERPSFAEQRVDAEEHWRSTQDEIENLPRNLRSKDPEVVRLARAQQESIAFAFQKQLAAKVAAKQLDEASAGLLLKWGNVIEELDQRTGGTAAKRLMNEMVSQIPSGSLTETQVDTFRRLVRS